MCFNWKRVAFVTVYWQKFKKKVIAYQTYHGKLYHKCGGELTEASHLLWILQPSSVQITYKSHNISVIFLFLLKKKKIIYMICFYA